MYRKFLGASFVLAVIVSVVAGEEFFAGIRKVDADGKNVTFIKFKKGEKGEEETLPVADNVKVVNGKFNKEEKKVEAGDAIEGGLKNERFKNIEKGVGAMIVTEGGKITEIRALKGFGKKQNQ